MNVKYLGSALALGSVVALLGACGDSGETGGNGGSADTSTSANSSTSGGTKASTSSVTVASSSTGMASDGNDTIDTAQTMDVMNGISIGEGELNGPDTDVDFFKFTVAAPGNFLIYIRRSDRVTDLNPDTDIDPYLTLYGPDQAVYAVNDDRYPRSDKQSEILTYLPAAGDYYLKVQEWCTSDTMDPMFCNADYFNALDAIDFAVIAIPMTGGTDLDVEAAEPNNTAAGATVITATEQDMMPGSYYLGIAQSDYQMASDEDWFSVTIPANLTVDPAARPSLGILFPWGGINGNGSKARTGMVEIVDTVDDSVIGRIDFGAEPNDTFDRAQFTVPVAVGGTYLVKVTDGGMESDGQGTFYYTYRTMGAGDEVETNEAGNGTVAGAETPEVLMLNGGPGHRFEGNLGAADVDYFQLSTGGLQYGTIFCDAQRTGSGVRGLKATLYAADGTTPITGGTGTESATTSITLPNLSVTGNTNVVLRVEKASQDADVAGDFYHCAAVFSDTM